MPDGATRDWRNWQGSSPCRGAEECVRRAIWGICASLFGFVFRAKKEGQVPHTFPYSLGMKTLAFGVVTVIMVGCGPQLGPLVVAGASGQGPAQPPASPPRPAQSPAPVGGNPLPPGQVIVVPAPPDQQPPSQGQAVATCLLRDNKTGQYVCSQILFEEWKANGGRLMDVCLQKAENRSTAIDVYTGGVAEGLKECQEQGSKLQQEKRDETNER